MSPKQLLSDQACMCYLIFTLESGGSINFKSLKIQLKCRMESNKVLPLAGVNVIKSLKMVLETPKFLELIILGFKQLLLGG